MNLADHEDEPWGVAIDWDRWTVTRVDYSKQFEKLGVKVGQEVLRVNGTSPRDDPETIKILLQKGPACKIILNRLPIDEIELIDVTKPLFIHKSASKSIKDV